MELLTLTGSVVFGTILDALQDENTQILYVTDCEPVSRTLSEIEIYPEQGQVIKAGVEIYLNYREFSIFYYTAIVLGVYLAGNNSIMWPGAGTMN